MRTLAFTGGGSAYEVWAVSGSTRIPLGRVLRDRRSTDSNIAGTRFRRPGKGAVCWRAEVPREQWEVRKHQGTGEPVEGVTLATAGQLQGTYGEGYRLEEFGERWDRRADAALALMRWFDRTATPRAGSIVPPPPAPPRR